MILGMSDVACPMESGPGILLLQELHLFRDGGRGREVVVAAGHRSYGRWLKKPLLSAFLWDVLLLQERSLPGGNGSASLLELCPPAPKVELVRGEEILGC